jgi:hypothetical protein
MVRFWQGLVVGGVAVLVLVVASVAVLAQEQELRPRDWLRIAPDDDARWQLLESMFGGFAPAMTSVRNHYGMTYESISDGNLELARWHWDRIKTYVQQGYLRRPDRQPNADAIFINTAWVALDDALAAGDAAEARARFLDARNACVACHVAEDRPYFNDQRLFWETAEFPAE